MDMMNEVLIDDERTAVQQLNSDVKGIIDSAANQNRQRSALEVMMLHVVLCYFLAIVLLNVGHGKILGIVSIYLVVMAFLLAARYFHACLRYIDSHRVFELEKGDMLRYLSDLEQKFSCDTAAARMYAMKGVILRNLESPKEHSLILYSRLVLIVVLGLVAIVCILVYFDLFR